MAITYTGRLARICNLTLSLFNDTAMQFVKNQSDLLVLVNLCKDDLAAHGAFPALALLDTVANVADIDLGTVSPAVSKVTYLFRVSGTVKLYALSDDLEISRAQRFTNASVPQAYAVSGLTLTLYPPPATTETGALRLLYWSRPIDLTGLTAAAAVGSPGDPDYEPAVPDGVSLPGIPEDKDIMFARFILWHLYERDRVATTAPQFAEKNRQLYERERASFLAGNRGESQYLRPYRRL